MFRAGRLKIYALLLLPFLLAGCGYSLMGHKAIAVEDIRIGKISNATYEPGLDDALIKALKTELMRQGFILNAASKNEVYGTLTGFQIIGADIKNDIFSAYQITITGQFYYKDAAGKKILLRGTTPYIITFQATDALNQVFADRQNARDSALKDLSSEIVSSLVYR